MAGYAVELVARLSPLEALLVSLNYAYPTTVFLYFLVASSVSICTLQTATDKKPHPRRNLIQSLMLLAVLSYLAQFFTIIAPSVFARTWLGQQDAIISALSCILVFGIQLAILSDDEKPVWYPFIGPYLLALVFEPALQITSGVARGSRGWSCFNVIDVSIAAARYVAVVGIVACYFVWADRPPGNASDAEQQPLLQKNGVPPTGSQESESSNSSDYGSASGESTNTSQTSESPWEKRQREAREQMEKRLKAHGNWFTYAKSFSIFIPYIWPVNNRALQFRAVLVGVCLLANNALNVLIPRQLGIVTDSLTGAADYNPWFQVLIFAVLKFTASEAGISLLRARLWIPVEYYSQEAMSTAAYSHVLNLSSDFHDTKSSSDIMMAIQSGQSISNMLESICFSAIPMLIDMGIAFLYLSVTFGPYEGLITIATAIIFIYIAGRMISSLRDARRGEVSAWFKEHYIRQAGIQGWSTVASFNQISHEERRYAEAVKDRNSKGQAVHVGYLMAYALQYIVLLAGLLAGSFLAVWQVTSGRATPGQFIMLLTYWAQLVAPLHFFAGLGKNISRNLIHAEQLLDIMKTKPTVVNKEDAKELKFVGGTVDFKRVCFSYDKKKPILKDIDFTIAPGTTVAFVGATGAGKSTILKLLDRFYDVTEGCIKIDGQDIREVDLYSLRAQIGIVPQAPILFDDTVINNVRYAKLHATDEEVHEACQAACIHDQILGFSDGYNTRVGERGIKLSGGELQRLAIARAILKRPSIVLLDEATSAVDTETEQKIQEALRALCYGRTTFIVAHRLSTVMNADRIIVVSGGEIAEQGTHDGLIRTGGKYADLWSKQVFSKPQKGKEGKEDEDDQQKENRRKAGSLLNDLSQEATNTELAKVKTVKTPLKELANGASKKDTEEEAKDSEGTDVKTPAGHVKEGSRLNPDAPTFTPRSFAAALATATQRGPSVGSPDTLGTCIVTAKPAADTPDEEEDMVGLSLPAPSTPNIGEADRMVQVPEEHSEQAPTDQGVALAETAAGTGWKGRSAKVRWKRPRYSRRVESKSEPSAGSGRDA